MDTNNRNQEHDDDENVYGMRKISYLEKYGVKHFPYRGRRKYTPLVYQSDDGGMIISNDVFGLAIKQFERAYKDCLGRRKTHEQWLLNLRYPDKSSNEYLEYLQNCIDCDKDCLPWPENESKERILYELLVKLVGTEIEIRTRQRVFIIQDMIYNAISCKTQISSGSLAEGLDLPESDRDVMYVVNDIDHVDVIKNVRNIKQPKPRNTFTLVMETDTNYPGFTRLRLIAARNSSDTKFAATFESTKSGIYLSVDKSLNDKKNQNPHGKFIFHGPCLSNIERNVDFAFCLRSKFFPQNAVQWVWRYRQQWPPNFVIDKIKQYGCLLVPVGPKNVPDSNILWRLSFSMGEKQLVYSFNFTQLLCYGLLKVTLKHIINKNDDVKDLLCSYFLKTALFWVSEEVDIETFQISKLFTCFFLCLSKLKTWVHSCYCPNYFIPEHNMFLGKIASDNNQLLLCVLNSIQFEGVVGLTMNLFPSYNETTPLLSSRSDSPFIMLDFFFYRMEYLTNYPTKIAQCYKILTLTKSLMKSESSLFIIDVCKYEYGRFSQFAAQLLRPLITKNNIKKIYRLYHKHLENGINTDATTGWLLYASYYYVTGQYNVTLKLADYIESKLSPSMLQPFSYSQEGINRYMKHLHSTMTLRERMSVAASGSVAYLKHSPLIPKELHLEVNGGIFKITSIVMCACLRFLCYHNQGDILNRQQALCDLSLKVKVNMVKGFKLSNALTLLGVCMELSGDKNTAYEYFQDALQCDSSICPSAAIRISNLFDI